MEIYLESLRRQTVDLALVDVRVHLAKGERIHTENSYKYTVETANCMLERSGYVLSHTWFDHHKWFALHLAKVEPSI